MRQQNHDATGRDATTTRCYAMTRRRDQRDDKTERRRDDEMQYDDATIKQIGHDEMRQGGAGYNDEARRDAMTRRRDDATTRRLDDNETRGTMRDETQQMTWLGNTTGRDGTR